MKDVLASVNTRAILDMQRKLYCWSRNDPRKVYTDLFNLVCDRKTLAFAWSRLSRNSGSKTPGIDGVTRHTVLKRKSGVAGFLEGIREELRSGTYRPQPVRQKLIPKPGKPGKFRPLGIPTLKDRLVQMALKIVLEPIFEADFYPNSYGFRRGRCAHDAISMIIKQINVRQTGKAPVNWVIEADVKACFDNIDHHGLMECIRKRVKDTKVLRLVRAFLKAGIMAEGNLRHPVTGTPQGGIVSPLLANIYLSQIDARYRRWIPNPGEPSSKKAAKRCEGDRLQGRPTFYIVRYADDFIVLTTGTREDAENEKARLADFLGEELGMELSLEKTLITRPEDGFNFLGYRIVKEPSFTSGRLVGKQYIPKEKLQLVRTRIKQLTRRNTTWQTMDKLLRNLNSLITGWRNYYRYAVGAYDDFYALDNFTWHRVQKWARKKHKKRTAHQVRRMYAKRESPRRWTWGGDKTQLRLFVRGGTMRYKCRGTKISNGWNDEIDGVKFYLEAARSISGLAVLGEHLR
ncbi:MAG: group II intron reverse transcriptase/maturase [Desulfomonile tiedjei]|nr:group II intron reverse transcriptase/maturase [Desulfomonile tiedjei]